jgi:benzodiazapine receptor
MHTTETSSDDRRDDRPRKGLAALGFVAATAGVAALGTLVMRGRGNPKRVWFRALRKPSYQPPDYVFGPVWTVLYATIAYAGYRIWRAPDSKQRSVALGLWTAQLILNGAWTPLFFGARKPLIALGDMIALDAAAIAFTATATAVDKPAAALIAPYLGWLGFATALNAKIVAKNPSALIR